MGIKQKVYNVLSDRKPQIKQKFENYLGSEKGQKSGAVGKFSHLLGLNFSYYVMRDRSACGAYIPGVIPVNESCIPSQTPEEFAHELMEFDLITFDVFDTLIYRYVARPTDVFYFTHDATDRQTFRKQRIEAESVARTEKKRLSGSTEVTLEEISEMLEKISGIDKQTLIQNEFEAEKKFCFATPYMKKVWNILLENGKKPMILSDMYLGEERIRELLGSCGYDVSDTEIIVSCDIQKSKYDGKMYKLLKKLKKDCCTFAHVGDNGYSDIKNAEKAQIKAFRCDNPDSKGNIYRTKDMSPFVQSVWAGLVNKKMYGDILQYDKYFGLGYNYLGILMFGFLSYVERLSADNRSEVIFCGEKCEIIKNIYEGYFGNSDNSGRENSEKSLLKVSLCETADADTLSLFGKTSTHKNYIEADNIGDVSEFVSQMLCGNDRVLQGVKAFISDYVMMCRKFDLLKELQASDVYAPFKSAFENEKYIKELKSTG